MAVEPEIRDVMERIFVALFSGTLQDIKAVALDHPDLSIFIEKRPNIERVEERAKDLQLHKIAEYPDGHVIIHAYFMGTIMPMTLVKGPDGAWKADLRWWVSTLRPRTELFEKARACLYGMVTGNPNLVERTCLPNDDLALLSKNGAPAGEHGQYEDVCANMPMVELAAGEPYPWPMGQTLVATAEETTGDRRVLMAQFGADEITFKMHHVNGEWYVDASPFIAVAKRHAR